MPNWRRSKSGHMKSSILITFENWEGSISSTLGKRNLKKPSRMFASNWKHQWLLRCPAKWRAGKGITEWNQVQEWFKRFSRCWISMQWTIPRCKSTSVFPTSPWSWRNAEAVLWECRAVTMGRQTFGTHMVYRETFLKIQWRLLQHLNRKSPILGSLTYQNKHHRL